MSESKPRYYHEGDGVIRESTCKKSLQVQPGPAFRIKPLEWQKHGTTEMAWVFGGSYMATSTDWCFRIDDGVDDASGDGYESIEDAKAAAEQHWQARLSEHLEPIK